MLKKSLLYIFVVSILSIVSCKSQNNVTKSQVNEKSNILFIAVDDLKPLLNAYGNKQMITPNFDKLIQSGVMFENAEVQQAVCGPSRASVMTGVYPDRTHVWDLHTDFRESSPTLISMPEYLITQGYQTAAIGKIYHKGSAAPGHDGKSWSVSHFQPNNYDSQYGDPALEYYQNSETKALIQKYIDEAVAQGKKPGQQRAYALKKVKPSCESEDVSDEAYQDGVYTKKALQLLKQFATEDKPFFLAVGYQKPHLPFIAPKKYWDLYDRDKIELAYQELTKGSPDYAFQDSGELNAFTDIIPKAGIGKPLSVDKQKELIHGYMACVSYIDAQLGKLLDELERLKLTDHTVIVLWGDHGYHLGDHTLWCKHSNFEQATRIPLIFSGPGVAKGKKVSNPVELIDLFPTLFDLVGVKQSEQTDGKSLVPLLDNNSKTSIETDFALSQYPRQNGKIMGYSIRTNQYRYTVWFNNSYNTNQSFDANNIMARELFDYNSDPLEKENHANEDAYKNIIKDLEKKLEIKLNSIHERTKLSPIVAYIKKDSSQGDEEENIAPKKEKQNKGKK